MLLLIWNNRKTLPESQQSTIVSITEKISKKTERIEHTLTFGETTNCTPSRKCIQAIYKYQVFSGQFQWPKILSLCNSISRIYHMDYSENLSQQYKFEPQSYHFNKSQYSLHCTLNIQLVIPCHMNMFIISQIRLSIILPSLLPLLVIFWKSISHISFNLSQIFVPDNLKVNKYFKNGSH